MKCDIISFAVPNGPPNANGNYAARGITQCRTHHWQIDGTAFVGGLCPIGRIEHATEQALERIAHATDQKLIEHVQEALNND
jgi:hypothetical protein